MKKKVIIAVLCAVSAIGISVLLAYLISEFTKPEPVEKPANILEVSWYAEDGDEFVITTAEELREFAELSEYYSFEGQTVRLGADIVLNEGNAADFKSDPPKNLWKPIVNFAGTFDGQGHTISGLYAESYSNESALFIRTDYHCTLKNFSLKNSYFRTTGYVGSASIMANGGGTLIGIYSDAVIDHTGENVGGIASMVTSNSSFEECWFDGSITTTRRGVGGIVDGIGETSAEIKHCLFSGTIVSTYIPLHYLDSGARSGGLIGYVMNGGSLTTEDCLVCGTMKAENYNHSGGFLGVLGGNSTATVSNVFVTDKAYRFVLGAIGGSMRGLPVTIPGANLIGAKGYAWTGLDFDRYWAAVDGGTPVLSRFAGEKLSLDGIEKAYDTGWYSEGGSSFVISDAKEFFGLIYVSAMDSFENKTISLDADIELNTGFAGDWDTTPPENVWQPIGINIVPFKGTFDGNMHTVSGLYINTEARYNGLFGAVQDATIKNLKLKNSYIASADQWTGSFAGRGNGTFTNLYSNAIIVAGDAFEGGILGQADYGPVSMSNCWFDGSVTNTYSAGENSRGFVGGFIGYIPAVATVIEDCLFTGDIDISGMKVKTLAGASGFVGVMEGSHEMRNILMIGNIKAGESIGYYAHTGQGTPVGGVAYAVITAPNEEYTDWQGNYGGRPSEEFDYHELVRKASVGSLVKYTMPEFDWENTWLAVSGGHPVLQVFADEALPSAEWIDISWYDAEPYVLTDIGDLYGFQELVNSGVTFEGKTVSLGADIVVNPGSAGNFPANEPEYLWIPIGKENTPFKGTFDGGMHTISGIYLNSNARHSGLFGCVKDANIRNLKLKNRYIASGEQWTGGIAGRGNGTFTNLYSNAIVVAGNAFEGGILGQADYGPVSISNCWVAGTVVNTYSAGENSRGFVGGFVGFEGGFPVALQNCLFTGRIDISSMRVKDLSGTSGFIGISEATPTLKNVVMLGTIKAGGIIGYYAHIGQGTPTGSGAYAVLEAPDGNSTNWPGNYGGKPTDQFKYKAVSREGTIGSIARFTMPDLDWGNAWTTVSGNHPVLRVFANEVPAYPETIDVSWYDANGESFTVTDAADLMGLAELVNSGVTFEGKTVVLGNNITFNTGNAADWADSAPQNKWMPIGRSNLPFRGTFDGQGHTISGLYTSGADRVGFFGLTVGATVRDLKITNSYFASTGQWVGSFIGQGSGTLINLYSDAILTTSGAMIGGIVGANDDANNQDLTMESCWFDGKLSCTHSAGTNSGAFMGGLAGHFGVGKNTLNNCLVTGSIDVSSLVPSGSGNMKTGGFIGVENTSAGTKVTKSAFLGTFITGENAGKPGMYALAGDSTQRNMNGSALYAMVDYNEIAGGYSGVNAGYSIAYVNLGVSTFPIGEDAVTRMPALDWENVWQTRENDLPALRLVVGAEVPAEPEPEPEPEDDKADTSWYDENEESFTLTDPADLLGLAELVNSGVTFEGKTLTLENDIEFNTGDAKDWSSEAPENEWIPIGKKDYPFKGTFDGQGHTISGLYASGADRIGFFGLTVNAVVKDLKITNSYFASTGQWIGSFIGQGSGTLTNLYSDAIITSSAAMIGGIVGANDDASKQDLKMESCWFDGEISCTHSAGTNSGAFMGGLVGHLSVAKNTLNNCLVTGNIDVSSFVPSEGGNMKTGGFIGVQNTDGGTTVTNSAFLGTFTVGANAGKLGMYALAGDSSQRTMNGSALYAMVDYNVIAGGYSSVNAGYSITYTNLGVSSFPIGSDASTRMPALDWENVWQTRENDLPALRMVVGAGTSPEPEPEPGTETEADKTWYDANEESFTIMDAADLLGLAELVNSGVTFEGKTILLENDIEFNTGDAKDWSSEAPVNQWTPIGKKDYPFKGTFDGQGHTISGLYASGADRIGFFGLTVTAIIKDIKITNSYFASTGQWIGSFIGQGSGTLTNLYSDAIVTSSAAMIGGIVGANDDASKQDLKMESCWFDGKLTCTHSTGTNSGAFMGGLVGHLSVGTNTLNNCLVTGNIDVSAFVPSGGGNIKTGGFIGVQNTENGTTVTNSAFLGTFTAGTNAGKVGLYALAGDSSQRTMNGSALYAMVDYHMIAGGYSSVSAGYSITYTNLGVSSFPIGSDASTRMPALDWENVWQVREGTLPGLKALLE